MQDNSHKLAVVHFIRKRRNHGNFSLEFIFDDVREILKEKVDFEIIYARYLSNGILRRLMNAIIASGKQGKVNHITGDVHYLNLFFRKSSCVLTVLDCGFMLVPNPILRSIYKMFWLTLPEKRAAIITAISEATKLDIIKHTNCDPAKIKVIPVAVSSLYLPHAKPFNSTFPSLLQIGTSPNKNIYRLADAVQGIPCKIVIVGFIDDNLNQYLTERNILFENKRNISTEEMYQCYVECDIVTFTSTFEGFGMPIVEANCVERVVITGNNTSMPEVAGNAACIVDPYSTEDIRSGILKLINDSAYRKQLLEQGRTNRERFSRERIANMYLDVYQQIAGNQ